MQITNTQKVICVKMEMYKLILSRQTKCKVMVNFYGRYMLGYHKHKTFYSCLSINNTS